MKNKFEIQKEHPSICYSCKWARKVADTNEQKGYVGCVLRLLGNSEKYDHDEIIEAKEIAEGWVYTKRAPFQEKSNNFGSGVMTNFQLITLEVKECNQYTLDETILDFLIPESPDKRTRYIVNGKTYFDITEIPENEFINTECIETIEYLTKEEIEKRFGKV